MKVTVQTREGTKKVAVKGTTVGHLLNELNLKQENYVVIKNKKIVLSDHLLKDGDRIRLVPVVSGG